MLRLPSQQAFKALRNLLRNPLPHLLRSPLQARQLHDEAAPFSGPPSYTTLARRFSYLSPNPMRYFVQKEAKEAIDRGEFVDIHDIGGVDPKDFDVLITDVNNNVLHSEISKLAGIPFLKEATKEEADKVVGEPRGFVFGQKFRQMLPCVLTIQGTSRWVHFIVDSGAPLTYISAYVAKAFNLEGEGPWLATVAGRNHPVHLSPPESHFSEISIIGGDFCTLNPLRPWVNEKDRTVTYYIGAKWKVVKVDNP